VAQLKLGHLEILSCSGPLGDTQLKLVHLKRLS
jgi:hypothetical protein